MVLADKFTGKPRASLFTRTLLYVLGFGLGSLLVAGVIAFTLMSVAESALAPKPDKSAKTTVTEIIGAPPEEGDAAAKKSPLTPKASKARRPRGNEAADDSKGTDQPL